MTTSVNKPESPIARLILAHGAGADKDSEFMVDMAELLCKQNIEVIRFNFPYMEKAKELGKKRPPDRAPALLESYHQAIASQKNDLPLFIGGKSMGGRISTLVLEESRALGSVCLGYPFHPPGKPEKLRTEHLENLNKPLLVVQGERDTFGNKQEVSNYALSASVQCVFMADGDHSLKPRKASGLTQEQHMQGAAKEIASFIAAVIAGEGK